MKVPTQKVIIRADNIYNYYAEHGSLKLYVDPMFKPGQRRVIVGDVHAVCDDMYSYSNIANDLKAGDKVYFHYNAISEDALIPDQKGLWLIDYDRVFCAVRGGEIIMMGGRILAEPVYDEDIVEIDIEGVKQKAKLTASGLVKEINPGHNLVRARLSHMGNPLIGDDHVPIKPGDVFFYIKNADFKNTIEGKDYFVMMQDEILAIDDK